MKALLDCRSGAACDPLRTPETQGLSRKLSVVPVGNGFEWHPAPSAKSYVQKWTAMPQSLWAPRTHFRCQSWEWLDLQVPVGFDGRGGHIINFRRLS